LHIGEIEGFVDKVSSNLKDIIPFRRGNIIPFEKCLQMLARSKIWGTDNSWSYNIIYTKLYNPKIELFIQKMTEIIKPKFFKVKGLKES